MKNRTALLIGAALSWAAWISMPQALAACPDDQTFSTVRTMLYFFRAVLPFLAGVVVFFALWRWLAGKPGLKSPRRLAALIAVLVLLITQIAIIVLLPPPPPMDKICNDAPPHLESGDEAPPALHQ